ncbi:DUF815 domain-containing protein, partial [uncultured Psychrobacter sp.]|uniref:DUF815 domain-containing protein n=1 Tax=uncultured Psychrobacter sp. TaxID=259303 RepID=UPI00261927AF
TYLQIVQHYLQLEQAKTSGTLETHNEAKTTTIGEEEPPLADDIRAAALRWASERGGRSGRVAYQFSRYFSGKAQLAAADSDP